MPPIVVFLVWVLGLIIVMYVAKLVIDYFEPPEPIRKIVLIILMLIALVLLLHKAEIALW